MTAPRALVRFEFHKGFPADAAIPLVEQLAELGVSHLSCTSLLRARTTARGERETVDHATIDPDVGGEPAVRRLATALRRHGMGLVMDLAPGQMAVGGSENGAWLDLLAWGRDSAFAHLLDVDWTPGAATLRNKIFAPFLDRPYGDALTEGALTVWFDPDRGTFSLRHRHHRFPICPLDYGRMLDAAKHPALSGLKAAFDAISSVRPDLGALAQACRRLAAGATKPSGREAIAAVIAAHDAREPAGLAILHALLERQNYQLAVWSRAADDLNWRRAGDDPEVAAVKIERPDVFDTVHGLVTQLYADGVIDGLRIRHPDRLADPVAYFRRLHLKLEGVKGRRPQGGAHPPLLYVDKAFTANQPVPADWAVTGLSGLDFTEDLARLQLDPAGVGLDEAWAAAGGDSTPLPELAEALRRHLLLSEFGAEFEGLARAVHDMARLDVATRDVSLAAVRRALTELVTAFAVPRTYAGINGRSAADAEAFATALTRAREKLAPLDQTVAGLLDRWLGKEAPRKVTDFEAAGARERAIGKFQELTAQVYEAAIDGALVHRYGRLLARCEPGRDLSRSGETRLAFHAAAAARAAQFPAALLTGIPAGRHFSADARARLVALSEYGRDWKSLLGHLAQEAPALRDGSAHGVALTPADEAVLFQAALGLWPLTLDLDDGPGLSAFAARLAHWHRAVLREARQQTNHAAPNTAYEAASEQFLRSLLCAPEGREARDMLSAFVQRIAPAGALNALAETVLRHTLPGVPEVSGGLSDWDFTPLPAEKPASVVIPRGVTSDPLPDGLLEGWRDGRLKMWLGARLLRLRRDHPELLLSGGYAPLSLEGMREEHGFAFARRNGKNALIVVVTLQAGRLLGPEAMPPRVPAARWGDTALPLPATFGDTFTDLLTGREVIAEGRALEFSSLLSSLPAAILLTSS